MWWPDPGPCIVCGAPHTTCVAPGTPTAIVIPQLPCRDGLVGERVVPVPAAAAVPLEPPPSFTTATYRRAIHGPKRRGVR
jgi:hypothetical protein